MRERRFLETVQHLRDQGMAIVDGSDTVVVLNLRNLAVANGSIERGREALYAALEALHAIRVDVEPVDIAYVYGNNVISHAIARGLESRVPTLVQLLTAILPDELFDHLDQASAFVCNDRNENADVQNALNGGAGWDLFEHGFLDNPDDIYRDRLHWEQPEPPPLPAEFRADVRPWVNPFDVDGDF